MGRQPGRYGPETTLAPAPASEHAAGPSHDARPAAEPVLPDSGSLLPTEQAPEPKADPVPDSESDAGLAPPALTPTPEPVEAGSILESVAFEGGPLSPAAEEPLAPRPVFPAPLEEELYLLSSLSGSAGGAVETTEGVDAGTLEMTASWSLWPAALDGGLFDVALVSLFSGIEVAHTPESELAEDARVSSPGLPVRWRPL